jgi:hypothetical protein
MTTSDETRTRLFRVRVEPFDYDCPSPRDGSTTGVLVLAAHSPELAAEGELAEEILARLRDNRNGDHLPAGMDAERVRLRLDVLSAWLINEHAATVVLPVWCRYAGPLDLSLFTTLSTTPPPDVDGLAGVIYDTPQSRRDADPSKPLAELLAIEVDHYQRWFLGQLFRYVIEARDGETWRFFTEGGGFYSEDEARQAGENAVPDGYRVISLDVTTDRTLAAAIAQLDEQTRTRLATALRDYQDGANDRDLIAAVRDALAADHTFDQPVIGVLFDTMEYDNGYFLTENATALFADGTVDILDLGSDVDDALTKTFGCVGQKFTVAVDLRDDSIDDDDYASEMTIYQRFRVAEPEPDSVEQD